MVRAIVWKEVREQVLIAAMLAVLGGALMAAVATFTDSTSSSPVRAGDVVAALGPGRMLTLMLVVTAGMVCGGTLFAGEKESGTMPFLDSLPGGRLALWRAKILAGLLVATAEVAALLIVAVPLGLADGPFALRLVVYVIMAFAWGVFGSTLSRTTLGSVGFAIPAASTAAFVFLLPITLLLSHADTLTPRPLGWAFFEVLMLATPLVASAWWFTAPDRLRSAETVTVVAASDRSRLPRPVGWGYRALCWLALRQLRIVGPVLSLFALAFGLALLLPSFPSVFVWPGLALTAGVLAGVTTFADEQSHHSALFWGEFRLPVGRIWWVKVGLHFAMLGWLLFLLALPSAVRAQVESDRHFTHGQTILAATFHTHLFDELGSEAWKYLLVPAVYGFVCGHLCCLLFRKIVVACGVAMVVGGVSAVGWGPSLLAGGVHAWQVWLPALVVLICGRVILRAWSANRATTRRPLVRLAWGCTIAVIVFAFGLAFRVLEVPDEPGGEDDVALVASLPSYDANVGGREFRMATERYARCQAAADPRDHSGKLRGIPRASDRLEVAVRTGDLTKEPDLCEWLDQVYADQAGLDDKSWPALAAQAASRPTGTYDPPQLVGSVATTVVALDNARRMSVAILARAIQRGNPAEFVQAFRIVMALTRTVRRGGGILGLEMAIETERLAVHCAVGWLLRLPATRSEPVRALARALAESDPLEPLDLRSHLLADRYVVRGMMVAPAQWLSPHLGPFRAAPGQGAAEADLVALAWTVPWERERTRRLVGLSGNLLTYQAVARLAGRPGGPILLGRARAALELAERELHLRVAHRAATLTAAVLAYQVEHGRAPAAPSDLVGDYLPRWPEDPFASGQPMSYRVSPGEVLVMPPSEARVAVAERQLPLSVRMGQVVIWSVGHDQTDDGGRVPPGGPLARDLVFVVPAPLSP